jgi:hypothetical protein
MDKSHFFGFWREHCGDAFPSIFNAQKHQLNEKMVNAVANYLVNCPVWIASPGIVRCAMDDSVIAGTGSVLTDGVWAWQDTMACYVRQVGIAVPAAFLQHIEKRRFEPPNDLDVNILQFPEDFG